MCIFILKNVDCSKWCFAKKYIFMHNCTTDLQHFHSYSESKMFLLLNNITTNNYKARKKLITISICFWLSLLKYRYSKIINCSVIILMKSVVKNNVNM